MYKKHYLPLEYNYELFNIVGISSKHYHNSRTNLFSWNNGNNTKSFPNLTARPWDHEIFLSIWRWLCFDSRSRRFFYIYKLCNENIVWNLAWVQHIWIKRVHSQITVVNLFITQHILLHSMFAYFIFSKYRFFILTLLLVCLLELFVLNIFLKLSWLHACQIQSDLFNWVLY